MIREPGKGIPKVSKTCLFLMASLARLCHMWVRMKDEKRDSKRYLDDEVKLFMISCNQREKEKEEPNISQILYLVPQQMNKPRTQQRGIVIQRQKVQ